MLLFFSNLMTETLSSSRGPIKTEGLNILLAHILYMHTEFERKDLILAKGKQRWHHFLSVSKSLRGIDWWTKVASSTGTKCRTLTMHCPSNTSLTLPPACIFSCSQMPLLKKLYLKKSKRQSWTIVTWSLGKRHSVVWDLTLTL